MKTEDWQKVNEIVLDALELNAARRPEFIENCCIDAPDIRREVESLLAGEPEAEAEAEDFFGAPAVINYAGFFNQDEEPDALAGQEIGNYRIIREIGRAVTLDMADKTKEALESFASAIEISEQLKKEDPNNVVIVYDIAGSYFQMGETQYGAGDYQSALAIAQKAMDNCREILEKNPAHTQSIRVTARSQHLKGKSYAALAEKSSGSELWQKSLENYRASLEIYNKFRAEGKSAGYDNKTIADLEKEIGKIENKIVKR